MRRRAAITSVCMCLSVLLVVAGALPAVAAPSPATVLPQRGFAAYEWHTLSQVNAKVSDQRLDALRDGGFRTIYVNVAEYLRVAGQSGSPTRRSRLNRLTGDLRRFVSRASGLGFAVHAVAGGPHWTDPAHRQLGPRLVQLIADYNAAADAGERLQGIQLDIEPYAEAVFWHDVGASLGRYLSTFQAIVAAYGQARARAGNEGLRLGFAIPFWLDGTPPDVPEVAFGATEGTRTTKAAAFHLIDMVRELPEVYVLVMAYRNVAAGPDGSIEQVGRELAYAGATGAACGIVVAQEFTAVTPEKLSFWWTGRAAFRQAATELAAAYGHLQQFRGLAVHDMNAYLAARD
jgi:hypothetical protein